MTEQEAQTLAAKLTRIWMPDGSFGEGASWKFHDGNFEYSAQINDELKMRFGGGPLGGESGFHLKRSREGQTAGHLYCAQNGAYVRSSNPQVGESAEEFAQFAEFYSSLMRGYCWLSGCPIELSESEQETWTGWRQNREETGRGKATHPPQWEVQRVAVAFDVDSVTVVRRITGVHYEGLCSDVLVTWELGDPNARVKSIQVGERSYCGVYLSSGQWEWEPGREGHEQIARGLYRLGFEDEGVLSQLDSPLTGHDKIELRLSMPREFWPPKWIEEAG